MAQEEVTLEEIRALANTITPVYATIVAGEEFCSVHMTGKEEDRFELKNVVQSKDVNTLLNAIPRLLLEFDRLTAVLEKVKTLAESLHDEDCGAAGCDNLSCECNSYESDECDVVHDEALCDCPNRYGYMARDALAGLGSFLTKKEQT